MTSAKWMFVLPPSGAARKVSQHILSAFSTLVPADQFKSFDTAAYLEGLDKLLHPANRMVLDDLLNQAFCISCLDFKPDYCLVSALSPLTLFSLELLKKYGISTGLWFYEDFHKATYINDVYRGYDHIFAIQRGELETMITSHSVNAFHFFPTATSFDSLSSEESVQKYDIIFIGIPSSYRIAVLEFLVQKGFSCAVAGKGWGEYEGILSPCIVSHHWCEDTEAFDLMRQARIGLNISIDNPTERTDVHISPRIFDYAAAECSIISEDVPLLSESFPDGNVHTFTNIIELPPLITSLKEQFDSDLRNRRMNRTTVLTRHQYIHRVAAIIKEMSR